MESKQESYANGDRAPSIAESTHSAVSNASGNTSKTASTVAAGGGAPPAAGGRPASKRAGTAYLAVTIMVWYGLTVLYSVYNTAVLQVFPFPLTVLSAELFAGVLLILPAWILGTIRTPNLKVSQLPMIFYVSLWHTISHASTGAALRHSSLAAVTAVQALEPLASAVVDRLMAGETSHTAVNLSLIPIVVGVLLVSREASLTWEGLYYAVASSASVGVRDMFSKRASRQKEFHKRPLSAANTYAVVTMMSFGTVMPYAFIVDGPQVLRWWSDVEGKEPGVGAGEVAALARGDEGSVAPGLTSLALSLSVSGILLFLHSAAAFHVLNKMGSVTAFSIANSVKRGVVISAGVVLMGTPMELVPALGAVVAVGGTAAYWVARMLFAPRRRRKIPRRQ